jgi:predicted dehydrogenase
VRWTEQRNFEAILDMLAAGALDVDPLISHRFRIDDAAQAYDVVSGSAPSLGILLEYPQVPGAIARTISLPPTRGADSRQTRADAAGHAANVSFIGAGNYATSVLIPAFRDAGATLRTVASSAGVTGLHAARKFGFQQTTTDTDSVFADAGSDTVVITTRHDSHARLVVGALSAGKNVFVEKPLCITLAQLDEISEAYTESVARGADPRVMVGFNRRFAPQVLKVKKLLQGVSGPRSFIMTVNAGAIPADHWTQDPAVGGGRIVGEACHFIDLLRFLAGSHVSGLTRTSMTAATGDTVSIQLSFADGSIGTVHYFANGSKAFPKERLDVFASGRVLSLDNFRKLSGFGWGGFKSMNLRRQDKGQKACAAAFLRCIADGSPSPIPFDEILEVSRLSILAAAPARVDVDLRETTITAVPTSA